MLIMARNLIGAICLLAMVALLLKTLAGIQ